MAISFNKVLGTLPQTLAIRNQRAELIASNIANANTPGYKAKDIDFKVALQAAQSRSGLGLSRTDGAHIYGESQLVSGRKYRIPDQPDTGDGNTVDVQMERNDFVKNAIEYQASIDFIGGKFNSLTKVLKGE